MDPQLTSDDQKAVDDLALPGSIQEEAIESSKQLIDIPKHHWYKSKKVLITVVAAVVVLSGGTAFMLVGGKDDTSNEVAQSQSTEAEEVKRFGVAVGLAEGNAEYSVDGTTWQELSNDTDLKEGNYVKTGESSRTVLLLDDGSAIRLDANTEVNLKSLATNDVRIDNLEGQVYTRVVASEERAFGVYSDGQIYVAKGTAYRTISTDTEKGVQVFHSKVDVPNKNTTLDEGSAYFTKSADPNKQDKTTALDLNALKEDEFIKWCADQDKQTTEFADKLGVLADIDKPAETPAPTTTTTTTTKNGIVLKGSQSEYNAVFSWTVTGLDASKGFKLVRSKKTTTPTYPNDAVVFIEPGKTSYTLADGDGNTYNYRLCIYRDGACDNYSNSVSVATKKKEKAAVEAGAVALSLTGTNASWTFAGTAPNGFKLIMSTTASPTYPGAEIAKYVESTSVGLPTSSLTSGSTYYIRVCKYTNEGGCQDYSNELTYLAP